MFELVEPAVDEVALLFGFEGRVVRDRERGSGEEGVVERSVAGESGESGKR